MAKLVEASDDVVKLFEEVLDKATIPQWIEFKVLCNNKQKNDVCKLFKANELLEVLTKLNFVIVINEEIFSQLPEDLQKTAIDECLAGVGISETDALSVLKPNFYTHTGVLKKYGHQPIIVLKESIKSLYDVRKQQEEDEKAAKKGKRGRKPKQ
jgi:nitrogen regulatory protein PII